MLKSFINFLFPAICGGCARHLHPTESQLCIHCLHNIARYPEALQAKAFKSLLYGRVDYKWAYCLFYFQKQGPSQEALHNLKYRGHSQLSYFFGDWMGEILKERPEFKQINAVIPVPLHAKRLRSRGYNQVEGFGKRIAYHLQVPYIDYVLKRRSHSQTQVFKNRLARTEMIDYSFYCQAQEQLANTHILLVDDLITTGATIEACYLALKTIPNIKLSLATIALNR